MHMTRVIYAVALCFVLAATGAFGGEDPRTIGQPQALDRKTADHARYIIKIAGCND